jgi:hypothetical protein
MVNLKDIGVTVLCKTLQYLNNKFDVIQFEKPSSVQLDKYLTDKGFTEKEGWYYKGFVLARVLNDCVEIRTIEKKNNKVIRISTELSVLETYIEYISHINSR